MKNDMTVIRLPLEDRILSLCRLAAATAEGDSDLRSVLDQLQALLHEHNEQVRKTALETLAAIPRRSAKQR